MAEQGTKITRDIEKYGLESLNDQLKARRSEDASLRDLADFVNKRILEAALAERDVELLSDVDRVYELLTNEDVSVGNRTEVETKLQMADVPIEEIRSDFVSHQTIKHHLNTQLNVDTGRESTLSLDDAQRRINWAQSQNEAIIQNTLEQFAQTDGLNTCEFDLATSVRVTCKECSRSFSLYDFLERGRCGCSPETDSER